MIYSSHALSSSSFICCCFESHSISFLPCASTIEIEIASSFVSNVFEFCRDVSLMVSSMRIENNGTQRLGIQCYFVISSLFDDHRIYTGSFEEKEIVPEYVKPHKDKRLDLHSLPGEFSSSFRCLALGIGFVRNLAFDALLSNSVCTLSGSSATTGSVGGYELGGKVTSR